MTKKQILSILQEELPAVSSSFYKALEGAAERIAQTLDNQAVENLTSAYEDYIKILSDEITEMVPVASVHGWRSQRVKDGQRAREEIKALKEGLLFNNNEKGARQEIS